MRLRPDPHVSAEDLVRGQHALVLDAAWASMAGALSSGVVLAAFALALGGGGRSRSACWLPFRTSLRSRSSEGSAWSSA